MVMISPQYEGLYGSIEKAGKHSIQTLFYHLAGFPIWPQDSYLVSGGGIGKDLEVMEIKRHVPSIVVGYVRGWTTMSALSLLAVGVAFAFMKGQSAFDGDPMPYDRSVLAFVGVGLGVLGLVVAALVWFLTRRALSDVELAKRALYADHVGVPVDPAYLPNPWSARDDLKRELASNAESSGLGRSTECFDRWPELVLAPQMATGPNLQMGLTLTRLCVAAPEKKRDPATLVPLHDAIWQRLVQLDPTTLSRRP